MELTPTPKIAPKSPKSAKRPKIWRNEKQKDRAVLPKQKLIVFISRLHKFSFETDLTPKIAQKGKKKKSPEGPKKEKKEATTVAKSKTIR